MIKIQAYLESVYPESTDGNLFLPKGREWTGSFLIVDILEREGSGLDSEDISDIYRALDNYVPLGSECVSDAWHLLTLRKDTHIGGLKLRNPRYRVIKSETI